MPSYKEETIRTYDAYADVFDQKFDKHFEKRVRRLADEFIELLPGKRIMDLGSGPGNHAKYFAEKGLDVLCVDLSKSMVECCRMKGLDARLGDIEALDVEDGSYDGIWAYTSLLHVPKEKVPDVIRDIRGMLVPGGILGIALKQGEGEGYVEEPEKYPGMKRWFTLFSDDEVRAFFDHGFTCVSASRSEVNEKCIFLNYIFRKK